MSNEDNNLYFEPVSQNVDLLCDSIKALLNGNQEVANIEVAQIDPKHASGDALCNHYNIPFESGANCIIVEAARSQTKQFAACVYPYD